MSGQGMFDNDRLPLLETSEAAIAEDAPAAAAYVVRKLGPCGDVLAMLGIDGSVAR